MDFRCPVDQDLDEFRATRHSGRKPRVPPTDDRTTFERDRDRILYSQGFRRLALITQVVGPNEGYAFHNRLTHVLKVAQVAKRLTLRLLKTTDPGLITQFGGLDPFVVEAAALAHDLGHPPFGHVAEEELHALATKNRKLEDGFEGNAQTFRVITKLEVRESDENRSGLDLSRATLNAILKYPWHYKGHPKKKDKWGAYESEAKDFAFARQGWGTSMEQSLEAAVMDWADDIAYSVHDLEDFYRAGMLPLERLSKRDDEMVDFLEGVYRRLEVEDGTEKNLYRVVANSMFAFLPPDRFEGRRDQKALLRALVSETIAKFESNTKITAAGVEKPPEIRIEVTLLKQLIWHYVIENPLLATQQRGQRQLIRELFDIYMDAAAQKNGIRNIFPSLLRDELEDEKSRTRAIVDLISGYTEQQLVEMHHRLTGAQLGSALRMGT